MRSRLPSVRARLEQPIEARSAPTVADGTDMDRSEGEATAGDEPMDE